MTKVQHPFAFCKTHGFFGATAFGFGPGSGAKITGCSTTCPACGQTAEILPGTYEAFQDRMNLQIDPSISKEALAALRQIVEQVQANKITPDEAKVQAEKVVPGAGRIFDVANWSDQAKATLYAGIITGIAVLAAAKLSNSTTIVNVAPTTERVIERPVYPHQPKLDEWLRRRRAEPPAPDDM